MSCSLSFLIKTSYEEPVLFTPALSFIMACLPDTHSGSIGLQLVNIRALNPTFLRRLSDWLLDLRRDFLRNNSLLLDNGRLLDNSRLLNHDRLLLDDNRLLNDNGLRHNDRLLNDSRLRDDSCRVSTRQQISHGCSNGSSCSNASDNRR